MIESDSIDEVRSAGEVSNWMPKAGTEISNLLEKKLGDEHTRRAAEASAIAILSRAVPPGSPKGSETGLVVGYVQSGKTLSLTSVAALARDNGYQIVIVVTGTSIQLFQQSTDRIRSDLQIRADRIRSWAFFENPEDNESTRGNVQRILEEWSDPEVPLDQRQSVLFAVMKHHVRLANLTELLVRLNLHGISALIIDDEADQASLNNEVTQGSQSTTYRRLLELKDALPSHTLLQYTATPQAPLLINIIDAMSPNFVRVLEPGATYTGGESFFSSASPYLEVIPPEDVPTKSSPLVEPPPSLMAAMRVFMVGVAVGLIESGPVNCRSMLVHPSHLTAQHFEYIGWIRDIFTTWSRDLRLPIGDPDRETLVSEFELAYNQLAKTVNDLPDFRTVVKTLPRAFNRTGIVEVNRREGRAVIVDWSSHYGWILVGGQSMDRGFTIEGLTVTYMPRGVGVGNADTVQQRARFFGHKRSYLGFCRVYMERQTLDAFLHYVEHEREMHRQLLQVQAGNQKLDEWKRSFVLSPALKPCRSSVLDFDYMRGRYSDVWVTPQIIFTEEGMAKSNRSVVDRFLGDLNFSPDAGSDQRTDAQRHEICSDVPLKAALENLLVPYRIAGSSDSQRFIGLLLQLSLAIEKDPSEVCVVYKMSPGLERRRSVDEDGQISNLFQGEAPTFPLDQRGSVYPGDRKIRQGDGVTIQIHSLNIHREDGDQVEQVATSVAVLAVYVPARMGVSWVSQYQSGQ